jgi:hypothetical protein
MLKTIPIAVVVVVAAVLVLAATKPDNFGGPQCQPSEENL